MSASDAGKQIDIVREFRHRRLHDAELEIADLILPYLRDRLGPQQFGAVEAALVQKHLQEREIVAPGRQQATAAAEELAVRYLHRDRLQTSVRSAAMHADKARRLVGGRNKTRVRHAERGKICALK